MVAFVVVAAAVVVVVEVVLGVLVRPALSVLELVLTLLELELLPVTLVEWWKPLKLVEVPAMTMEAVHYYC